MNTVIRIQIVFKCIDCFSDDLFTKKNNDLGFALPYL